MAVNNEYVNRVDANGQTLIDLTNDTATASDVLEGRTLHLASGAPAVGTYRPSDEIEARLEATVGHSTKNLLQITLESGTYTSDGANLTYTVDKIAGTITINGNTRASGNINLPIYEDDNGIIAGKLYISGGYSSRCRVLCYDYTTPAYVTEWDGVTLSYSSAENESKEFMPISGHRNQYRLQIGSGQAFDNVVIRPMLRDGSIADDTFEPYVMPTDERIASLEAQVATSAEIEARLEATVGHSSKNLFDISGQNSTNYGVRWYEENGRLRAVGTYNDNAAHSQPRFYTKLKAGSYIFSGSPIYSETGVRILIGTCLDAQGTNFTALGYDEGNGFTFTLQSDSWVSIRMFTSKHLYQQSIDLTLPVMLREASIADDTFEPYVQPTDERIIALEARVAALEAIINNS